MQESEEYTLQDALSTHARKEKINRQQLIDSSIIEPVFTAQDGSAIDSASYSQPMAIKDSFTRTGLSDQIFSWYVSHGFIGFNACALIAQHWLINRACEIKGKDAARGWFKILSDDGVDVTAHEIKLIERLDRKFKLKKNLVEADKFKNIFGIRHVLFLVDGIDYEKPFNPEHVRKGRYKGMSQIDPYWIVPELTSESLSDPSSISFYEPEYWVIKGKRIHKSHFVILRGADPADILKPSYRYGGISLAQMISERIYAAERCANEAPQLLLTKRLYVRKMNLMKAIADQSYFEKSLAASASLKDNHGFIAVGGDEEITQFDTSLSDLDNTISSQYQIVAAIAGVPVTKLMKTPPRGFQSTGENEREDYHEEIQTVQENDLSPIIEAHHIRLMRSDVMHRIDRQFEIEHEWLPLSVMSDEQRANVSLTNAQAMQALQSTGAIDAYDIRDAVILDPNSPFTGIEAVEREEGLVDLEEPESEQESNYIPFS